MEPSFQNLPSSKNGSVIQMEEVVLAIKTLNDIRLTNFKEKLEASVIEVRKFLNKKISPNQDKSTCLNKIVRKAVNECVKRNFLSEKEKHCYQRSFRKLLAELTDTLKYQRFQRETRRDGIKKKVVKQKEVSSRNDSENSSLESENATEIPLTIREIKGIASNVASLFCEQVKLDRKCKKQPKEKLGGYRKREKISHTNVQEKEEPNEKHERKRVSFKLIPEKRTKAKGDPKTKKIVKNSKTKVRKTKYVCKSCINDLQQKEKSLPTHKIEVKDTNIQDQNVSTDQNDKIMDLEKPPELSIITSADENQPHQCSTYENENAQRSDDLNQNNQSSADQSQHSHSADDVNQRSIGENPENVSDQNFQAPVIGDKNSTDTNSVVDHEMMECD